MTGRILQRNVLRRECIIKLYQVRIDSVGVIQFAQFIDNRTSRLDLYTYLSRVSRPEYGPMGGFEIWVHSTYFNINLKGPNLNCFISRVASHPERLQYIYFDTILLLRAVARLGPYLSAFDYCSTGKHEDDAETWDRLSKVLNVAEDIGRFDESVLFRGENANVGRSSLFKVAGLTSRAGSQGGIQGPLQKRNSYHGLRWL